MSEKQEKENFKGSKWKESGMRAKEYWKKQGGFMGRDN